MASKGCRVLGGLHVASQCTLDASLSKKSCDENNLPNTVTPSAKFTWLWNLFVRVHFPAWSGHFMKPCPRAGSHRALSQRGWSSGQWLLQLRTSCYLAPEMRSHKSHRVNVHKVRSITLPLSPNMYPMDINPSPWSNMTWGSCLHGSFVSLK